MDLHERVICRLCFSPQDNLIDIFNEPEYNVIEIISEHIGVVCTTDALPKYVCTCCWQKIDEFHRFHRCVQTAQEEYLKQIVKCEVDNELDNECIQETNFIEIIPNYDEFSEFVQDFTAKADDEVKGIESVEFLCNDETNVHKIEVPDMEEDELAEQSDSDSGSSKSVGVDVDPDKSREIFAQHFDTTCDICNVELKSLKRAITHYSQEHDIDEGYIKCCGLKLKRDKLVNDHIRWHLNPDIFKCRYCERIMKTKLSLATHIANHRHAKTYTCDICGRTFTQITKIRHHMESHSKRKHCHICSKSCASAEKLDEHLKFYHKTDEVRRQMKQVREIKKTTLGASDIDKIVSTQFNMKCDYCEVVFKSLQEAQYHYMHEHQIADGYIQCCGLKFKKIINIEGHVLWHLKPELFVCCVCKKESTTVIALRAHLRVHEARQPMQQTTCPQCNKTFFSKQHLTRHMRHSHGVASTRKRKLNAVTPDSSGIQLFFDMRCEICKIEMSSLQHAKLHYLEQHDINDGYIKCCEMKFRELKNINDHLQYHINPNIFKCTICMKVFPRKADLSAHISQHKAVETKRFSCNECGKAWKSKYRLEIHKRSHEKKTARTFPCDFCNRKVSTEKLQKSHTFRIHEADKEAKTEICEYCAKTFTTRKEVLAHIRGMHTENSIRRERAQCQICDAWLSNRYTLKEHMIRHNSEPRKCSQCDKISPNQHALLCHIREVHCDRIFRCHLCPKTFKAAVALKDHVATHTGEKMHKCSFCPEAFIWRPNMYSHQKKAHPDEWKMKKTEVRRRST